MRLGFTEKVGQIWKWSNGVTDENTWSSELPHGIVTDELTHHIEARPKSLKCDPAFLLVLQLLLTTADHCAKGFQWGLLLQRLWLLFGISYRWRHKLLVFHTCSIHVYLTFVIRNLYGTDYHLLQFKKAFDKSKCTLYIVLLNVMLNYCLNIWLRLLQNLVATAQLFLKYNS